MSHPPLTKKLENSNKSVSAFGPVTEIAFEIIRARVSQCSIVRSETDTVEVTQIFGIQRELTSLTKALGISRPMYNLEPSVGWGWLNIYEWEFEEFNKQEEKA